MSFFALKHVAHLKLGQEFKKAIDTLKGPFEKYQPAYDKFLDDFGTYYFSRGNFGKVVNFQKILDTAHLPKGQSQIEQFVDLFKNRDGSKKKRQREEWEEYSTSRTRFYGGDSTLAELSSIDEWCSAEVKNPWLYRSEVKPIYLLIEDETIQSEVQAAFLWRQIKVAMKELEEMMKFMGKPSKEDGMLKLYAARAFNLKPGLQLANLTEQYARVKSVYNDIWHRTPKYWAMKPKVTS